MEINESGATVDGRWWLVEANMASPSDTENLNVDASVRLDFLFIILAEFGDFGSFDFSVGNIDVFFGNVNVLEEIVPHVKIVRFRVSM